MRVYSRESICTQETWRPEDHDTGILSNAGLSRDNAYVNTRIVYIVYVYATHVKPRRYTRAIFTREIINVAILKKN